MALTHVGVKNDVQTALNRQKANVALYMGGMGLKKNNFIRTIWHDGGFGDAAERLQELFLGGAKEEAIATVSDEWIDLKSSVGPPKWIKRRYRAWENSGATGLIM